MRWRPKPDVPRKAVEHHWYRWFAWRPITVYKPDPSHRYPNATKGYTVWWEWLYRKWTDYKYPDEYGVSGEWDHVFPEDFDKDKV